MNSPLDEYLVPDWPAPGSVKAVITTRRGGASRGPFDSFNLADHVGDADDSVQQNRRKLMQDWHLRQPPLWLKQVHGTHVVDASRAHPAIEADGSFAFGPAPACVVMTADCLPVLLCDRAGERVAALHAGWRGLAAGIIEQGLQCLQRPGEEILVYLGPAIGPAAFEVGGEVRDQFCRVLPQAESAFSARAGGKWLADIYQLARQRLLASGVEAVFGGGRCTVTESSEFFSYRRDRECGRMASLIWVDDK